MPSSKVTIVFHRNFTAISLVTYDDPPCLGRAEHIGSFEAMHFNSLDELAFLICRLKAQTDRREEKADSGEGRLSSGWQQAEESSVPVAVWDGH